MRSRTIAVTVGIIMVGLSLAASTHTAAPDDGGTTWTTDFRVEKGELAPSGRNPFFILEPGYTLELESKDEHVTITVLPETKQVDGFETRIVEERETKDGKLVEISRNYFAISTRTNGVFYLGESVDIYRNGAVASHEGAWVAGVDGARFGLMIPGEVLLGARFYQEIAPKVAMDRAELVSVDETVSTPAGEFKHCVKFEETTPLEPGEKGQKYYAPGVGLVRDGSLKLVKHGMARTAAK